MTKILKKFIFVIILIIIFFVVINFPKIQNYFMKRIYTKDYSEYIEQYSEKYQVDADLVYAMIKAESNFNTNALSNKGAKGIMQLMPATASDVAKSLNVTYREEGLLEPDYSIMIGTKYISSLIEKYQNISLALAAYNAGGGNVDKWIEKDIIKKDGSNIENIPYKETNNYVRKILRDYKIYKRLYSNER